MRAARLRQPLLPHGRWRLGLAPDLRVPRYRHAGDRDALIEDHLHSMVDYLFSHCQPNTAFTDSHFSSLASARSSKCLLLAFPRQAVVEKLELQISADVKKLKCQRARKFCRSQSHGTHFSHIRDMGKIRGARRHALVTHVRHSRAVGQDTSPRAGQKCQIFWTHRHVRPSQKSKPLLPLDRDSEQTTHQPRKTH